MNWVLLILKIQKMSFREVPGVMTDDEHSPRSTGGAISPHLKRTYLGKRWRRVFGIHIYNKVTHFCLLPEEVRLVQDP